MIPLPFPDIVNLARFAPSVHNTQPALWARRDNTLQLWADPKRALKIGDAKGTDMALSMGMAIEATQRAGAALGWGTQDTLEQIEWQAAARGKDPFLVATLTFTAQTAEPSQATLLHNRRTCRTGFQQPTPDTQTAARACIVPYPFTWIDDAQDYQWCIKEGDKASTALLRHPPYRDELLSWMRLHRPDTAKDGMTVQTLGLSPFMAKLAHLVLAKGFKPLDALGLANPLLSEWGNSKNACGMAFLTTPTNLDVVEAGRLWMRYWLDLTTQGFAAWPMASLTDHPPTRAKVMEKFGLTDSLWGAFRVGTPKHPLARSPRMDLPILP